MKIKYDNGDASKTRKVAYICDRRACGHCSFPECKYTTDIEHAINFDSDSCGGLFMEKTERGAKMDGRRETE